MSSVGTMANSANGTAKATAKPSMPIVGATMSPDEDTATRRNPMIGPVHEKLTSDSVNAMRKMLMKPLVSSDFWSILLLHYDGSVISNAPKNDAANTTSSRQNRMLNIALVDSALSALAPNSSDTINPSATYITTMLTP